MVCLARVLVVGFAGLVVAAPARAQGVTPAPSSAPAPAQTQGPRLEYSTVPGCLDEESFRHAVASYMEKGLDPFRPDAPDLVRVVFKKIPGGYRGSVQYTPAQGDPWPPQETTGATCAQVFRSAARVASIRAEPVVAPDPPAPPPPTEPPPPPLESPSPPPSAPVASQTPRVAPATFAELRFTPPKPPPPMDLTITLSTALLMTAGFTADVGPALQLGGGLRYDWFSLDLELRGVFPGRAVASEQLDPANPRSPRSFDVSQLSAQLVPCARFATYFAGCGVVGIYTLITQDRTQGTYFYPAWSIGPRFAVEIPFAERFAVFGFAEALFSPGVAVQEYRGVLEQEDSPGIRWKQSIVSGLFGAGVSVKFQ